MEVQYWDQDLLCERTISVNENLKGTRKNLKLILKSSKVGEILKAQLAVESYNLFDALKSDVKEDEFVFFSTKAKPVLMKIRKAAGINMLTDREIVILFCDVIIPIIYGETEINSDRNSFFHLWIIYASRFLWSDMDDSLKRDLWKLCFGKTREFKDHFLTESEEIEKVIRKYPELKRYRFPIPCQENEMLDELLKYSEILPRRVFGYLLRGFYKTNTLGLSTEMIHRAFDTLRREDTMSTDEIDELENMPDVLTVYRGTDPTESPFRPSWSLDKDLVANSFARGKRMFTARINKGKVIAYWKDEKEIIAWVDMSELV